MNLDDHIRNNNDLDECFKRLAIAVAQVPETFFERAERLAYEAEQRAISATVEADDMGIEVHRWDCKCGTCWGDSDTRKERGW